MKMDIFDNLLNWGTVMELLEKLHKANQFDEHQAGLARILRYKDNWRLRETVLELCPNIKNPDLDLLSEINRIMMDSEDYNDLRTLAATSLGAPVRSAARAKAPGSAFDPKDALKNLYLLLNSPQPPIFHDSVRKAIDSIKEAPAQR